MLLHWDFERPLALAMQKSIRRRKREQIKAGIWERLNQFSSAVKKRGDVPRAEGVIDPGLFIEEDFFLTAEQMRVSVLALEVCYEEFTVNASRWNDFIMASPGNLPSYGIAYEDLLQLAAKLKQHMPTTE